MYYYALLFLNHERSTDFQSITAMICEFGDNQSDYLRYSNRLTDQ